jgi:hypothetical protein
MPPEHLTPATTDDIEQALAFALRYDGRRRFDHALEFMARITAAHLVAHLTRSGYVVMHKPPAWSCACGDTAQRS